MIKVVIIVLNINKWFSGNSILLKGGIRNRSRVERWRKGNIRVNYKKGIWKIIVRQIEQKYYVERIIVNNKPHQ